MKKSKNLFIVLGIIAALAVGFLAGISIEYPKIGNSEISGTIGKVKNYRKTNVSKEDIELRNELVKDTSKLHQLQNYLRFYYVSTAKMNEDVQFVISESNDVEAFRNANKSQLNKLNNYKEFLSTVRPNLLLAISACEAASEVNPEALRNVLNQANNIISQLNYREQVVLDYIDLLADFISSNKNKQFPGLEKAHDQLAINELYSALVTRDKLVLNYLNKTRLYGKSKESLRLFDKQKLNDLAQKDIETLGYMDTEKLGLHDTESLSFFDSEKLGIYVDAEHLGLWDSEKLGALWDTEKLGALWDTEKLGALWDSEKLGALFNSEQLGYSGGQF